jgi:hypothetical protein
MSATEEVVDPTGKIVLDQVKVPSRLTSLDGKRIAFVWDYLFKGPEMFAVLREELTRRYAGVTFVDYPTFGNVHGSDPEEKANLAAMDARLRENGVDAAIIAVGA